MDYSNPENRRNHRLSMMVGLSGSLFLAVFGLNALFQSNFLLGYSLLAIMTFVLFSIWLMRDKDNEFYGVQGISLAVIITFTYVLVSGGVDNTGPLWSYPLALIILLLQGFKKGAIAILTLLVIALVVFYLPGIPVAEYSESFKIRFIASFTALAMMSLIYEYLRWKIHGEFVQLNNELHKASLTDPLTQLANRRNAQEQLERLFGLYQRDGDIFSVVMVDIDHFKAINDRFGHDTGDIILSKIATILDQGVRKQDIVSRWGGEEFLILLPHETLEQSINTAEKLRQSIEKLDFSSSGIDDGVTASFGVHSITQSADIKELIVLADKKLYQAKRNGRNCVIGNDANLPNNLIFT